MSLVARFAIGARDRLVATKPLTILAFAWLFVVIYAYPGYMNWDTGEQLYQARTHYYQDSHPPVMTVYWRVIELVMRGPFPLLVLQTALSFWGLYSILGRRCSLRAAALATSAVLLFPPVLSSIAHVGPDAQMAGFLLGGLAFALRPQWRWRALGVVLFFLAVAVRDNAVLALFPLCTVVAGAWGVRRRTFVVLATFGAAAAVFVLAMLAGNALRDTRAYPWYRTVAIQDLAGIMCAEGSTDAEIQQQLRGIPLTETPGRDLHDKMCRAFAPRPTFEMLLPDDRLVFDPTPDRDDRLARKRAWVRMAKKRTDVFLAYRWSVMEQLLGLGATPIDPVTQTFTHSVNVPGVTGWRHDPGPLHHRHNLSWMQSRLGDLFSRLAETPIYWPWIYALLSLIVLVYAALKRNELAVAFAASGLLYEATFFLAAPAAMFHYSLWMIACTGIAIASSANAERAASPQAMRR